MAYYKIFLKTENQKFAFPPTSEDEVLKLLKDANPEKEAGIDNLSSRFLKDSAVVLALPISKLRNLLDETFKISFRLYNCQTQTIIQEIVKNRFKNYCSVSLLAVLSNVIGKVIHNQTEHFLSKNKILCKYQSVFRKPFSTNSCWIKCYVYINQCLSPLNELLFNIINWQNKQVLNLGSTRV